MQNLVKKGKPSGPLAGGDTAPGAPTKGATSSVAQLCTMLENARECRHIAICRSKTSKKALSNRPDPIDTGRYFGEKPKADVKESYCRSKSFEY